MIVDPRIIWNTAETTDVCCMACGGKMTMESGREIEEGAAHQWMWWRCTNDPGHITRPVPIPIRMARSF
jgi:hypothetical protein